MGSKLKEHTIAELEAEIKRRRTPPLPTPEREVNWDNVLACCYDYLDALQGPDTKGILSKHYIFESAMEAIYGDNIWEYVSNLER